MAQSKSIEFRDLRSFAHIARCGSFGQASQEIGIGQPALTRQIRKLEDSVGADLFIRHGRGVTLTTTGAILLERVEEIIHLLTYSVQETDRLPKGLVVAFPPEVGCFLISPVVNRLINNRPELHINLRQEFGNSLTALLLSGRVDIGLMYDPPKLDALEIRPLIEEPLLLVGAPYSAVMSSSIAIPIRELSSLSLILPTQQHTHRRLYARVAAQHGLRPRVIVEVDSVSMRKALVRGGVGYAIMPHSAVHDELALGKLCVRQIERVSLCSTLAIVQPQDAKHTPEAELLIHQLTSQAEALVTAGAWPQARLRLGK